MRAVFKILDCEIVPSQKGDICNIVLKSPGSSRNEGAITVTMFANDVKEGKHQVFLHNHGNLVVTDVEVELYEPNKGKPQLQHRFPFDSICVPHESYIRQEASKLKSAAQKAA